MYCAGHSLMTAYAEGFTLVKYVIIICYYYYCTFSSCITGYLLILRTESVV